MKRLVIWILSLALIMTLVSCGDTSQLKRYVNESTVYTSEEIIDAMDVVETHFKKSWYKTLYELHYDEEKTVRKMPEYKERYDAEHVIVLRATFSVNEYGPNYGFNPNGWYTDFMYILAKNDGEKWEIRGAGY
jgi:hypothetical protein